MKIAFVLGLMTFMSIQSHAVIADRFSCVMEVKDFASGTSTKQQQEFFVGRLPLRDNPAPDIRFTAGQVRSNLALDTAAATIAADLNFYFKHATKVDANGNAVEARQFTCIGLSGSYCERAGRDPNICMSGTVACKEPQDPFDPNFGWSPSTLLQGTPTFNERALSPATALIKDDQGQDRASIDLNCQYLGTFL